ncbi:MAG: hypothetical protein ACTHW2_11770 [Tissierella sp.]|uniref:hypothetical protein n=1 Tax=Tissierella sp. TaxID=41274 RepID=UPI003F9ADBF8
MQEKLTFERAKEKHLQRLEQYVPIVARVHGGTHPEFHKVHKLFDEINREIKEAGSNKTNLSEEFIELRKVTNNYTVPEDVCESYEAVYNMLNDMDKAYGM